MIFWVYQNCIILKAENQRVRQLKKGLACSNVEMLLMQISISTNTSLTEKNELHIEYHILLTWGL